MTANQIRRALPAAPRRHWRTVLAAVGLGMLALNLLTPLAADDYFFACRLIVRPDGMLFPAGRLRTAADLAFSLKNFCAVHGGRLPVHFLVELSTLLPGWVFDLVNAAVFAGLVAALLRLVRPVSAAAAAWTAAGGALLLWLATPAFGQDFLWQTGSVNYLWTMTATLWFVRPFVHPGWMPRLRRGAVLWFVLGLCSGWSMENQSAAACLLCTARLVQLRLHRQPLPRLLAAGAAGQWLGFVLLMAAPGNYHRSAGYGQAGLTPALLAARAASYTAALWTQLWWLVLVAALLTLLLAVRRHRQLGTVLWLWGGALACHGAMLASPTYPLRSMLGSTVFLTAAVLVCANALARRRLWPALACGAMALCLAVQLSAALPELAALRRESDARAALLQSCRAAGQTEVTVPVLPAARTRFSPFWGDALSDLMQDPANERNVAMAYYFGVETVRGDPDLRL